MDLEVNKELISSGNVRQHLKSINLNIGFVDFIYDARSLPNNNFYEVDLSKEDRIKKDLNFQNLISNDIEKIRKSYYQGKLSLFEYSLRYLIKIRNMKLYFNFHLKRGESSEGTTKTPALFMRGFLQLPEMSQRFKFGSKCMAYFGLMMNTYQLC